MKIINSMLNYIPSYILSYILSVSFLLALSGCGDTPPTPPDTGSTTSTTERSNPLQKQMDALNKAKNLEAEMKKSVEDRLKAIDGQK